MHIPIEFKTEEVLNIPPIPVGSVMHLIRILSDEIPKIFTKKMGIQEALAINVELQALTKDVVKSFLEAHMRPASFKRKKPDEVSDD